MIILLDKSESTLLELNASILVHRLSLQIYDRHASFIMSDFKQFRWVLCEKQLLAQL